MKAKGYVRRSTDSFYEIKVFDIGGIRYIASLAFKPHYTYRVDFYDRTKFTTVEGYKIHKAFYMYL